MSRTMHVNSNDRRFLDRAGATQSENCCRSTRFDWNTWNAP